MDISDILMCMMIYYYLTLHKKQRRPRKRDLTSTFTGHAYTLELLTGPGTQCHDLMRFSRTAYVRLCDHFRQKNWLQDSRYITVEEKMAIFLIVIGHNERFRVLKHDFQHSSQTIHSCFHEVLNGMMEFAKEIIVPTSFDPNPDIPGSHKALRRIFSVNQCSLYNFMDILYLYIYISLFFVNIGSGWCTG